mgnify:CR=1 FL=1
MNLRNLTTTLMIIAGASGTITLSAQDKPFVVQIRSDYPMEAIHDTIGNHAGLGLSLGYVVLSKDDSSFRGDGVFRIDFDEYSGNKSNVKSYTAALQVNLYPKRHSNFYVLFAPTIQAYRISPETQKTTNYSSFGVQAGIGWAIENNLLHSIEASYERMDRVESHEFARVRFDFCFRF